MTHVPPTNLEKSPKIFFFVIWHPIKAWYFLTEYFFDWLLSINLISADITDTLFSSFFSIHQNLMSFGALSWSVISSALVISSKHGQYMSLIFHHNECDY